MGIPEGEGKGTLSLFKAVVAGNFLNLGGEMGIWIHEAQRISNKLNRIGPHQGPLWDSCVALVNNPPANARDIRDTVSMPGLRRSLE